MAKQKNLEEIETDFRASIYIPENKPERQFFLCPVGLVGAGKSTVVGPMSKRFNLVRLSSDELREQLKSNGYDYGSVKDIGLRIARDFALQGYSITFDMDCGSPVVKSFAEDLAKELGIQIFFLHITAPEEFIFDKFRKYPPTWLADNPQTMIDNHIAQKETRKKENTQFDFFFTFDTSKPDLNVQIEECCNKLASALKV